MPIKHAEEYRNPEITGKLLEKIKRASKKKVRLMEVCGTHTMSIFRNGINQLLPDIPLHDAWAVDLKGGPSPTLEELGNTLRRMTPLQSSKVRLRRRAAPDSEYQLPSTIQIPEYVCLL